jgi:hypothetical protein
MTEQEYREVCRSGNVTVGGDVEGVCRSFTCVSLVAPTTSVVAVTSPTPKPSEILCCDIWYIYLTAIGLTPGGSGTVHILHTNSTQNTETEHTTIKKLTNLGSVGRAPSLMSYTLAFALQLRKKHGKTSVRVASCTSQTQYNTRTMNSTKHRRKIVTQSITMSQNNKERRIHNREKSSYQVSKPCVKLYKKF